VTYGYSPSTGLPTTDNDGTRSITRGYDAVARLTAYTDGDSTQPATTTYDLLSRPIVTNDLKGTQTRTYNTSIDPRGLLTSVVDSQVAGTFTATYDEDGAIATETYPNGLIACTTHDETGDATRLVYRKSSNCSSGTTWLDDVQQSSIHGQWLRHDATQLSTSGSQISSSQDYGYDSAARLSVVKDTLAGNCTTRSYDYAGTAGKNSNRTRLTTRTSGTSVCDTTSPGTVVDYQYDAADRESDDGFSYDAFGRTLQVSANQGGTATSATYYVNDRLETLSQGTVTRSYALDPASRVRQRSASDATTQTYHYADDSDSPSWTLDKPNGANPPYTRNVEGIDGDLVAIVVSGTPTLQLTNLHGDVVATASASPSATVPSATMSADEFGVPRSPAGYRYGWLGGKQRRTELSTGAVAMGQRLYLPQLGRFTQVDPVAGGSCNSYDYVCQDPMNGYDLDGRSCACGPRYPQGCLPGRCPGDEKWTWWDIVNFTTLVVPEFKIGSAVGWTAEKLAAKALAKVLAKKSGQKITVTVRGRSVTAHLDYHKTGSHAGYKHVQVDKYRRGRKYAGQHKNLWRSKPGQL
jgi:RHS repeat-associated protein